MQFPKTEAKIKIDLDTREVTVPESLYNIAVVGDHKAETVYIRLGRSFDGTLLNDEGLPNLTTDDHRCFIRTLNAQQEYYEVEPESIEIMQEPAENKDGEIYYFDTDDIETYTKRYTAAEIKELGLNLSDFHTIDIDYLYIGWSIGSPVTDYVGTVAFSLMFVATHTIELDSSTNESYNVIDDLDTEKELTADSTYISYSSVLDYQWQSLAGKVAIVKSLDMDSKEVIYASQTDKFYYEVFHLLAKYNSLLETLNTDEVNKAVAYVFRMIGERPDWEETDENKFSFIFNKPKEETDDIDFTEF